MRPPDHQAIRLRVATPADVEVLNHLFADAFTDRYHRDGLVGVRVPHLNPLVWDYAIRDAGDGAMLWFDEDDELLAFNIVHASVETMPRTVDNIGFYSRLGFRPQYLTVTLTGAAHPRGGVRCRRLSALSADARAALVAGCGDCLRRAAPDYTYRREMELTEELNIGDTVVLEQADAVRAFAVCHHAALAVGRRSEELRVLKLFATSVDTFRELMMGVEELARDMRIGQVAVRCQTAFSDAYGALIAADYQVRWTDLRMTLDGKAEPSLNGGAILLSNWEI
jgi:hypothetical protein